MPVLTTRIRNATALIVLSLTTAALGQQAVSPSFGVQGFEIERVSRTRHVGDGAGVTVVNRFGDVRARFGGYEGRVEILANVQHFADEGARLVVDTKESPAGIGITVGYRTPDGDGLITTPDPAQKKRADMVVYVPRGAPLSVSTDHGLVEARGLQSDFRARTASGTFSARKIAGELDIKTGAGDAIVVLERWDLLREHSIVSETGNISVVFGAEVDAVIRVATSGLISTDYSMQVDYKADRTPLRRGQALVGKGSSVISITSTEGNIQLVRRPLAQKARQSRGKRGEP